MNWEHPSLGKFKDDAGDLVRTMSMPGFKLSESHENDSVELCFREYEDEPPSDDDCELIEKIIANQADLAQQVLDLMWNDFQGKRKKGTPIWWSGDLSQVNEALEDYDPDLSPIEKREDIGKVMQLSEICIVNPEESMHPGMAELSFHADFEEEHGIGILTDGEKLTGIGFSSDVEPF